MGCDLLGKYYVVCSKKMKAGRRGEAGRMRRERIAGGRRPASLPGRAETLAEPVEGFLSLPPEGAAPVPSEDQWEGEQTSVSCLPRYGQDR